MTRLLDNPLVMFGGVLAIGALAAVAIGGDPRVSLLSWPALVMTFWLGRRIGREEHDA